MKKAIAYLILIFILLASLGAFSQKIILQCNQECREGGVKFSVQSRTPGGYTYKFENLSPEVPMLQLDGQSVVTQNNGELSGKVGRVKVTVTRDDGEYVTREFYGNTCDHDELPTDCPNNFRDISFSGGTNQGDEITATWNGDFIGCQNSLNWYNQNISGSSFTKVFKGRIEGFPAVFHAQPPQSCGECHGWTEIVIPDHNEKLPNKPTAPPVVILPPVSPPATVVIQPTDTTVPEVLTPSNMVTQGVYLGILRPDGILVLYKSDDFQIWQTSAQLATQSILKGLNTLGFIPFANVVPTLGEAQSKK